MNKVFAIFSLIFYFGCQSRKEEEIKLVLDFKTHSKIDTLDNFGDEKRKCFLLLATDSYGLGHIDFYFVVSKQISKNKSISYKILNANRVSNQYIALVKENKGIGWFAFKDGKMLSELPFTQHLLDSLKLNSPKDVEVLVYGDKFLFRRNEKTFKTLDYGNLLTKYKDKDFENLDYNLYKLQGDSLIVYSKDGNDILKQKDGVYFIPRPGYGIIEKYSRKEIMDAVDSVSKLSLPPKVLKFNPVK